MKNKITLLLFTYLICSACQRPLEFHTSYFGGGGYITGLTQNPHNTQELYGRCDVGGVYRSTDGGQSWQMMNNGMTAWWQHGVRSVVLDTVSPNTLYRCSGNPMGWQRLGAIFRSDDKGETWILLTDSLDYYGNGPVRNGGEMLAIDPHNHLHIVAGSFSKGLWQSFDQGITWICMGHVGERIAAVRYAQDGSLLVALTYDKTVDSLHKSMDFARGHASRLYRYSADMSQCDTLYNSTDHGIYDVLGPKTDVLLMSTTCGVLLSEDDGATWIWSKDVPRDGLILRLTQSPAQKNRLFTARKFSEVDTLRLYESLDYGHSWHLYSTNLTESSFHDFPNYGSANCEWFGASIAGVVADAKDTNRVFFSNYWGVNETQDGGKNWSANFFRGLNILCGECIHFGADGRLYAAICDHGVFVSDDMGENFRLLNPQLSHRSTRTLATATSNPDFLLWTEGNRRDYHGTPVMRSFDGVLSCDTVLFNRKNSYVQAIVEDPLHEGRYYLMQEGRFDDETENGGIYRSDDWGDTWYRVSNPYPSYISDLPYRRLYIDEDYLPVICYQTKNGSGTNKLMTMDRYCDVLYVGEWTEGIWRTMDGGETWTDISQSLPMREDTTVVLSQVLADPIIEGVVYAAFWKAGLWRSFDFGDTWTQVLATNAVSVDKQGDDMLVASSDHVTTPYGVHLYLSNNCGKTWRDVYDPQLGAQRFIQVKLDAKHHRLYALTCGNGLIWAEY